MPIEYATIPSGSIPSGHAVRQIDGVPQEWDGGRFIRVIPLVWHELVGSLTIGNQNDITTFVREKRMPGNASATMTGVHVNINTGAGRFTFSNGSEREFASWKDLAPIADSFDAETTRWEDFLIAKAYRASPDGTDKTTQVGANCNCDLAADVPVIYTGPVQ